MAIQMENPTTIRVVRDSLLTTLRHNRSAHTGKVAKARQAYRTQIIAELDKRLAEAKTGHDIDPGFLHILPIPRDYTLEYDRAIQQYEWDTRDEVDLSREDFNRYVRDEWEWINTFIASTQNYLVS